MLLLYRPESAVVTDVFFEELSTWLEAIALYKYQIVIAGDFNINMEIADDRRATALRDLLASFDCIQHVPLQPTHRDGGTLDLVVTKAEQDVDDLTVDPPGVISDHSVINWSLHFHHQPPIVLKREARRWSKLNKEAS